MSASCPRCGCASLRHLHDAGDDGTHLAGSERFECVACGHVLTRREAIDAGLAYTLDRRKHERDAGVPPSSLHVQRIGRAPRRPDLADAAMLRELAALCARYDIRMGGLAGIGINRGDRLVFSGRLDGPDACGVLRRAADQRQLQTGGSSGTSPVPKF